MFFKIFLSCEVIKFRHIFKKGENMQKVFAIQFLESMDYIDKKSAVWTWTPANSKAYDIYASGAPTSTNQSTYADGRDSRSDTDRPNEGMAI